MDKVNIVLLVGNGLGRAFNNEGFATGSILQTLFESPQELSTGARRFFSRLFKNSYPKTEEELGLLEEIKEVFSWGDKLHLPLLLYDNRVVDERLRKEFITYYNELRINFLKKIKESTSTVIKTNDFKIFSKNFCAFVQNKEPTIATLNYDHLLYNILLNNKKILEKYTDGFFIENGINPLITFQETFFEHAQKRKTYLHLHGSYLYMPQTSDEIEKQKVTDQLDTNHPPLVILTSQKKKIQNIFTSPKDLFRTYSGYFFEKLNEAQHIIIFGYGGNDEYLNTNLKYVITKTRKQKKRLNLTIVDYKENKESDNCVIKKWSDRLINWNYRPDICTNPNYPLTITNQTKLVKICRISSLKDFTWQY